MKYSDRFRAGIDNVRSYATSERVRKHGAVASALGKTCSALLEVVTEDRYPQTHKVIRGIGQVANVAAIASNTTAEIAGIFHAPETPDDTAQQVSGAQGQGELTADQHQLAEADGSAVGAADAQQLGVEPIAQ